MGPTRRPTMSDRLKDRYLNISHISNPRRGNTPSVYASMYIFIVMAEKVEKMFEVNVILVHAYENIKPISFA